MKARIEQRRIGIRIIVLLIVQTVCLAAIPSGAVAVRRISGTVICTETDSSPADSAEQEAGIRQQQHRRDIAVTAAAAALLISCTGCALIPNRTPVQNKVRMDS